MIRARIAAIRVARVCLRIVGCFSNVRFGEWHVAQRKVWVAACCGGPRGFCGHISPTAGSLFVHFSGDVLQLYSTIVLRDRSLEDLASVPRAEAATRQARRAETGATGGVAARCGAIRSMLTLASGVRDLPPRVVLAGCLRGDRWFYARSPRRSRLGPTKAAAWPTT